jgi:hypothetical protein
MPQQKLLQLGHINKVTTRKPVPSFTPLPTIIKIKNSTVWNQIKILIYIILHHAIMTLPYIYLHKWKENISSWFI